MAKKKEEKQNNIRVCDGIYISHEFLEKKENRLFTLLLKGFVVYLLSMGSIGFYLSALEINYNVLLCHVVILVMAIFCALLYYRLLTENIGYLILLIFFGGLVILFRIYINSGFYAIVNITVDMAAQYLNEEIQRLYNEQIGNRYITVTIAALFIGIVMDILLNVYVSRRMQYVTVAFIVMFLNIIPLYLICEPDLLYGLMMLLGMALTYVYKSSRHYSPQVAMARHSNVFEDKGAKNKKNRKKHNLNKEELFYVYDVKALMQAGVWTLVVVVAIMTITSAFKPKESFNVGYQGNKYKDLSMAMVSTLMTEGFMGFFQNHEDIGGMNGGKLGDVSSVRLDHETDLIVEMTPYTFDRIYLKSFVGSYYNPYENCWTAIEDVKNVNENNKAEATALKNIYDQEGYHSAKAIMRVRNIGADPRRLYLPYYTYEVEQEKEWVNVEYYPLLEGNSVSEDSNYKDNQSGYYPCDLEIPEANWETIQNMVIKMGLCGTEEQMVEQVISYYQDNIPYTIKPGKTPRKEDFINYFLNENKKGYCAHFASAAVLIFRYVGIPARYVEGYAIDNIQFINSDLIGNKRFSDYYDGYSEIGETACFSVEVTDASAHAWVEIYTREEGWHVVDVTPASEGEEEEDDFWTMFEDVFGDGGATQGETTNNQTKGIKVSDKAIKQGVLYVFCAFACMILIFLAWKFICYVRESIIYIKYNYSDKLISDYTNMKKKKEKRNQKLKECMNYRDTVLFLDMSENETKQETKRIIEILEKAGFSNVVISQEEYQIALDWLKIHFQK